MFSVIIPLYNKELSISNTIKSVLNQTFQKFEIIIINDGSTDNSVKEVGKFNDKRIRLIDQENKGVSAARNRGIKEAKYEWIAFLDADDLWMKDHLKEILRMMKEYPNNKVYATSFVNSKTYNSLTMRGVGSVIYKVNDYFKETLQKNLIWTGIVIIHKNCFNKVGVFNERLSRGEDRELWSRIAREYEIIKSTAVTATYKIDSENRLTQSKFDFKKSILSVTHLEVDYFKTRSEKKYFIITTFNSIRNFVLRMDFKNAFKACNSLFFILKKEIKSDSNS